MHNHIKVYIDTNTVSKLAENNDNYLLEFKNECYNKNIKLYYSIITIREIIHDKPEYIQYSRNRATVLNIICDKNVVVSPLKLFYIELLLLSKHETSLSSKSIKKTIYDKNGIWFDYELGIKYITNTLKDLKFLYKKNIKKLSIKNDHELKSHFVNKLKEHNEFKYIFDTTSLLNYLKGKINDNVMARKIAMNLRDPYKYINGFVQGNIKFDLTEKYDDFNKIIFDEITNARETINPHYEVSDQYKNKQEKKNEKIKLITNYVREFRAKNRALILEYISKHFKNKYFQDYHYNNWKEIFYNSSLFDMPSFDFHHTLLAYLIAEKNFNVDSRIEKTDGLDLMHAMYLPYFDVIQVDKRTKDLISKMNPPHRPFSTKVTSNIEDILKT